MAKPAKESFGSNRGKKVKKKIFRHAKKKMSFNKNSKNYTKRYKGQGR